MVNVYHSLTIIKSFNLINMDTMVVTIGVQYVVIAESKIVTEHEQDF